MPRRRIYATNAERQAAYRRKLKSSAQPAQAAILPLPAVSSKLGHKRWRALLRHATLLVDQAACEMQSYLEERSDDWQCSQRGEEFAEILDAVQDVLTSLGEVDY